MEELKNYITDIPDFPEKGIIFRNITSLLQSPEGFHKAVDAYFKADEGLRTIAEAACKETLRDIKVFCGRVVSGDQFVSDSSKKEWLTRHFYAYCTEMEGAAIAQAAYLSRVPFLIIRAISDKADDSTVADFPEFLKTAVNHSVRLTSEIIKKLNKENLS